jgi:hypothetical protein
MIFIVPAIVGAVCFIVPTYIYVSPLVATLLITGFAVGGNAWGFGGGNTYFAAYTKPKYWGTLNGLAAGLQGLTGFVMVSISGRWVSDDAALGGYGDIFLYTGLFWLVGIILSVIAKKRLLGDTWETAGGLKA